MWDYFLSHLYHAQTGIQLHNDRLVATMGVGLGLITVLLSVITPGEFTQWVTAFAGAIVVIGAAVIQLRREWLAKPVPRRRKSRFDREHE